MKTKSYFTFVLLCCYLTVLHLNAFADTSLRVTLLSTGGDVVPVCRVYSLEQDTCVYSDLSGNVYISKEQFGSLLRCSASGFRDTLLQISNWSDTLRIFLTDIPVLNELQRITVTASSVHQNENYLARKSVSFTQSDILNTAGTAGDISRYIATHPSTVASIGDGYDNTLYIRGGRPSEILFVVDGIEFDNVNHFSRSNGSGGPIGFINSEFIRDVNFYPGQMPVEYPSRLSSIIDITMRNGSFTQYRGAAGVKLTGAMLSLELPLQREHGSIVGATRYIDFSPLSKLIEGKGIPQLGDAFVKLLLMPGPATTLSVTSLLSYNHFRYSYPVTFSSLSGRETYPNVYNEIEQIFQGGGGVTLKIEDQVSQEVNASYSFRNGKQFDSLSDFTSEFFQNSFLQNPMKSDNHAKQKSVLKYKAMFPLLDDDSIIGGASYTSSSFVIKKAEYSQYSGSCIECIDGNPVTVDWIKRTDADSLTFKEKEFGSFFNMRLKKGIIRADLGVRFDYYGILDKLTASPSVGLDIFAGKYGVLSLSYGLYHQFPSEVPMILFNNLASGRYLSSDSLKRYEMSLIKKVRPYRNMHYSIGFKTNRITNHFLQSDIYYKWYDREFAYSNQYYISVLCQQDGNYAIADQSGKRKSMGIELQFKNSDSLWFHYSMGGSLFNVLNKYNDGKWYNDWTNVGYTMTLSGRASFLKHHAVSITASAMGGRPYTELKIEEDCIGRKYAIMSDEKQLNSRLDRIFSVNLRYACTGHIGRTSVESSLEILNVLNLQPALDYRFNGDRFIKVTPFGFTPVIGLTIRR